MKKTICGSCVGERYLANWVNEHGRSGMCEYCNDSLVVVTLEALVEKFHSSFKRLIKEGVGLRFSIFGGENNLVDAVLELLTVGNRVEVAEDLSKLLCSKDNYFSSGKGYWVPGSIDLSRWEEIERGFKYSNRYFNREVENYFDSITKNLEEIYARFDCPCERVIDRDQAIFRARVARPEQISSILKDPAANLGALPQGATCPAGRLNPEGLPIFYGSTCRDTAIAEVRPAVGDTVIVSRFNLLRKIKLLDLRQIKGLQEGPSPFDPNSEAWQKRIPFLKAMEEKISHPVQPGDESSEYLIPQLFFQFISNNTDYVGLAYRSSQLPSNDEFNIALSPDISKVRSKGTSYKYCDSSGQGILIEEKPSDPFLEGVSTLSQMLGSGPLEIDLNQIEIVEIKSVKYSEKTNKVKFTAVCSQT